MLTQRTWREFLLNRSLDVHLWVRPPREAELVASTWKRKTQPLRQSLVDKSSGMTIRDSLLVVQLPAKHSWRPGQSAPFAFTQLFTGVTRFLRWEHKRKWSNRSSANIVTIIIIVIMITDSVDELSKLARTSSLNMRLAKTRTLALQTPVVYHVQNSSMQTNKG